ncbi:uncharacterized protein PRD47_014960 [Ara ararauna]
MLQVQELEPSAEQLRALTDLQRVPGAGLGPLGLGSHRSHPSCGHGSGRGPLATPRRSPRARCRSSPLPAGGAPVPPAVRERRPGAARGRKWRLRGGGHGSGGRIKLPRAARQGRSGGRAAAGLFAFPAPPPPPSRSGPPASPSPRLRRPRAAAEPAGEELPAPGPPSPGIMPAERGHVGRQPPVGSGSRRGSSSTSSSGSRGRCAGSSRMLTHVDQQ